MENIYEGKERRSTIQVEKNGLLKVWHFIISQIILFITLLGFMAGFGSWALTQLQLNFYPNSKGIQLEKTMDSLNSNIEKQNIILTDLRLFIAGKFGIMNVEKVK